MTGRSRRVHARGEIVAYLERYAASFGCPVRTDIHVAGVRKQDGAGFDVDTADETLRARNLVVSTGAYQSPYTPRGMETLPERILTMDIGEFTTPDALPEGKILIIGSGHTGCQIAEALHHSEREVVLACGRAPWAPRRVGGKDLMWWLLESGFLDVDATTLPKDARLFANVLATGHGGGHDLHYRTLRDLGVSLAGRFLGAEEGHARFASELSESVAWGDERHLQLRDVFVEFAERRGLPDPSMATPERLEDEGPKTVDLGEFGAVLYTSGFRPDYASWLPWPEAFDEQGFPIQKDGVSLAVDGLYFVGLNFMRKRKSALLCGVGEDVRVVAEAIATH